MFKNIIAATDGSDHSNRAVEQAKQLAEHFGATLWLVHAYHHTSDLLGYEDFEKIVAQRKARGQVILDETRKLLENCSIKVEEELIEGPEAQAIINVANTRNADLIVIGTRGRGAIEGMLFGSVSTKVAQYAKCSVMVTR